jgi:hypothetical protein
VKPVVLFTEDGGQTWVNRVANMPDQFPKGEWGWKIQFLNDRVGFVSLENFAQGAILKTTDGGLTWTRLPINDPQQNANLEGVGFVDENHGWVGGWGDAQFQRLSSSETTDGGRSWVNANQIGAALNRFRFFGNPVSVGYASGQTVYKYSSQSAPVVPAHLASPPKSTRFLQDNRPSRASGPVRLQFTVPEKATRLSVRIWDRFGDLIAMPLKETNPAPGFRTVIWDRKDSLGRLIDSSFVIARVTIDRASESQLIHVGPTNASVANSIPSFQGVSHMANESHVMLPGSQRPLPPGAKVLGLPDPNHRIEITVKLRRKAQLPALTTRPKVALNRHESAAKYGATDEDIAKVKAVLGRYGLEVLRSSNATRSVMMAGPIEAMERALADGPLAHHEVLESD